MFEALKYIVIISYIIPLIWFNITRVQFSHYNNAKFHGVENIVRGVKTSKLEVKFYKISTILYNFAIICTILTSILLMFVVNTDVIKVYSLNLILAYLVTAGIYYIIAIKENVILNDVIKY